MASWKDRAQPLDEAKPSWKDRALSVEPATSSLESGLRGAAQGVSLGFEDELAGAGGALGSRLGELGVDRVESTHPEVQAKLDAMNPQKPFGDLYRESRDEERMTNQAAEKANPGTYLAGSIAGGLANPLARGASNLRGALGLGAAQGLGGSDSDVTEGEYGDAALDTAIGTGFGAGGFGVGKAIPAAARGLGNLGKKALTNLGPTAEAIAARFEGRAQDSAKSYPKLAEDFAGTLKTLGKRTKEMSDEAVEHLSHEPAIPKQALEHPLDLELDKMKLKGKEPKIAEGLEGIERFERDAVPQEAKDVLLGGTDKQVSSSLMDLKKDLKGLPDQLSERDIKSIIKKLDDNINWDDQSRDKLNSTLEGIRTSFDRTLKFRNPGYKKAMEPVADQTDLINQLKRQFNLKGKPGKGLVPTDTTATKIQTSLRENKDVTEANLKKLAELTGQDYSALAKNYQLAKQFQRGPGAQGSKRTNLGAALGAGGGALLGGPLGATLGAAGGAALGGTADAFGGKITGKIIDSILKAGNSKAFGKFEPMIQKAAEKGPEALAVVGSILGSNPEFREQIGLK